MLLTRKGCPIHFRLLFSGSKQLIDSQAFAMIFYFSKFIFTLFLLARYLLALFSFWKMLLSMVIETDLWIIKTYPFTDGSCLRLSFAPLITEIFPSKLDMESSTTPQIRTTSSLDTCSTSYPTRPRCLTPLSQLNIPQPHQSHHRQ